MTILHIYEDNLNVLTLLLGILLIMDGEQALVLGRPGFDSQLQHSLVMWAIYRSLC